MGGGGGGTPVASTAAKKDDAKKPDEMKIPDFSKGTPIVAAIIGGTLTADFLNSLKAYTSKGTTDEDYQKALTAYFDQLGAGAKSISGMRDTLQQALLAAKNKQSGPSTNSNAAKNRLLQNGLGNAIVDTSKKTAAGGV